MATAPGVAAHSRPGQQTQPRRSHRDYHSFWRTGERPGWLDRVLDQAATWLRERFSLDLDLSIDSDRHSSDRSKRAQILHRTSSRDHGIRLRVWNTNRGGTFIVTVLAVETPRGGWLQITVTCDDTSTIAKKPVIANQFLEVVEFEDVTPLRPAAEYTAVGDLPSIESLINSPERRLPVIIAAPIDDVPFDTWNTHVNKWTKQAVGIAHVVSLSPQAATEFSNQHGERAVRPGTLRTYPAGADLADPITAKTARWLSHQSLAGPDKAVEKTIENFVRQHAVSQPVPLPSGARDWSRAFDRIANIKLREAVTPEILTLEERRERLARERQISAPEETLPVRSQADNSTAPPLESPAKAVHEDLLLEVTSLRSRLEGATNVLNAAEAKLLEVQQTLLVEDLSEASLLGVLDLATRDIPDQAIINSVLETNESLQLRIETLEEDLLEEQVAGGDLRKEYSRLESEYAKAVREISYLKSKVYETDPEAAFNFANQADPLNPLGDCPATWDELVESRALEEHHIVITASRRKVKGIANLDIDGSALNAAWEALGTLASYRNAVRANSWDRDVHDFCDSGPLEYFHVPPNKHSRGETGTTKQDSRFKKTRHLPVPESVSKDERAYMWSHFKPHSWGSEKKLRIHYLDQVNSDGNIYVGHIGEHLPSASTTKVHR